MHSVFIRVRMFLSLIFTGGPPACIETAMGETRRWMNFVTWLSIFYTSATFQRCLVEGILGKDNAIVMYMPDLWRQKCFS